MRRRKLSLVNARFARLSSLEPRPAPYLASSLILGLGLFLVAAATSAPAFAQPAQATYPACTKTVSATESDLAHQKYIAGKQDYDEGNYESAVRRFRDAYNIDCTKHELLIIISAAYERKGDKKEAVTALETYVARAPNAPDISTYQAKIENLKKQIAAAPPPQAATPPPPPAAHETQERSPWPWVVAGAGVVAIGIGIAVVATAPSLPGNCDRDTEKCTKLPNESPADFQDRQDRAGRSLRQPTYGVVTIVGGGVLVAGGLLWHFLEPTGPKESAKTKVRPLVSPGYAGLSVGGTF
jgi:tetratricopeptide (TPR) repeat protein